MFAFFTTSIAMQLPPAHWLVLANHARGLSEGCISGLFLSDSSALRPEGQA